MDQIPVINDGYGNPGAGGNRGKSGLAIAGMVIGIVSLVGSCTGFTIVLAILGLIFSLVGISSYRKGMAITGIATNAVAIVVSVFVLIFYIAGSNAALSGSSSVPAQQDSSRISASQDFDEELVLSQLQVETLQYKSFDWNYAFLVIKNNSEYDISLSANVNFYDESGNLVGAKDSSASAVESGYEVLLWFMPDEDFDRMEYEITVDEETWFDCVTSQLSFDTTEAQNKIILSVTNNASEPAEFVQGSVLFFSEDQLVGFSEAYFTDDEHQIKPGKTINQEMDCYESFDSYRVFLFGRRS